MVDGSRFVKIRKELKRLIYSITCSFLTLKSMLCVLNFDGIRSMMAVSKLHEGGYKNLGWLAGGYNRSVDGDFPDVEGEEKLQYATIGGASYYFLQLLLILQAVGKSSWLAADHMSCSIANIGFFMYVRSS